MPCLMQLVPGAASPPIPLPAYGHLPGGKSSYSTIPVSLIQASGYGLCRAEEPLLRPFPLPCCSEQMPWEAVLHGPSAAAPVSLGAETDDTDLLPGCKQGTIFPN